MTLIGLVLACRRSAPPQPAPEALPRLPPHGPTEGAAASDATDDDQRLPDGLCHPAVVIATGRGGAILDACFDPQTNHTDLLGQRVDADSMAVGSRVRLRRVPGNVLSLSATSIDGTLRVAWISHVGDGSERSDEFNDRGGGARELSVLALDASLGTIGLPVQVNRHLVAARAESERRGWSRSHVELVPGPAGSVLALATDADEPCPQGGARCASWSVFSVEPDGTSRRVRHESAASPLLEPQSLIRVGDDLAYLRGADAVRSVLYVHSLRSEGATISAMPTAMFDPLVDWSSGSLTWTGAAVVALGEERAPEASEPRLVVRVTSLGGPSSTRPRASDDPEVVRWPLVTERSWRCVRRHPVLRIAWRGGSVDLDPTAPGASIDLSRWVPPAVAGMPAREGASRWLPPMAWMGRALLAIDGHDRLRRWTCPRDGGVPIE
jgi:hypothetical protein